MGVSALHRPIVPSRNSLSSGTAHFGPVPLLAAPARALCVDHAVACTTASFVVVHGFVAFG